ncbi:MAG: AAA family ATPase [Pseudonocardiales bacterium]
MIRKLSLRNFKSFRDATVNFGPVSIVLGSNGAGKSNLFDALRLLRAIGDGRSVREAVDGHISPGASLTTVAGVRGGASTATHFMSTSDVFELDVELLVDKEIIRYAVQVDAKKRTIRNEWLSSNMHPGPYVYNTRPGTDPLEQDPDSPVVTARFYKETRGRNPRRDFSPNEFILSQFVSRRAESRLNEVVADRVRDEFESLRPLELRPEVLRQYSTLGRTELGEHGENFAAVVWQLLEDTKPVRQRRRRPNGEVETVVWRDDDAVARLASINEWLAELTPRPVVSIEIESAPTGEVIFAVHEEPFETRVAAPSLSDGTLRFAALALATVGAKGRQTLVIEELENGINPARLSLLVKMIEQAAHADGEVQVIASTHSPAVLDYADQETINDSIVIGWDHEKMASRPVSVARLPSLAEAMGERTLGELQAEGWLQLAAEA